MIIYLIIGVIYSTIWTKIQVKEDRKIFQDLEKAKLAKIIVFSFWVLIIFFWIFPALWFIISKLIFPKENHIMEIYKNDN